MHARAPPLVPCPHSGAGVRMCVPHVKCPAASGCSTALRAARASTVHACNDDAHALVCGALVRLTRQRGVWAVCSGAQG